jgi:hypothetical protein
VTVVDHCRSLQLLLDHRYDLSQFPQPAFETRLVDPKVAASELGPRVHRQRTAAFGLLDIAEHDVSENPNSALRCTYCSVSAVSLVWTRAILGSEAITLAIAARNPAASTANNGGTKSLLALHKCGGHASASLGVVRRSRVSNATGPRSGGPKKLQKPFRSNHQDHTHGNDRYNSRHRKAREHYLHPMISQEVDLIDKSALQFI